VAVPPGRNLLANGIAIGMRIALHPCQAPANPLQSKSTRAIPVLYGMIVYFDGVKTYIEEWQPGEWIHVVDAADGERAYIYRDGAKRDSEVYAGNVSPQASGAPLRIGTRDLNSFFAGEIHGVRIWSRLLTEISLKRIVRKVIL
jgi:Concanavalin A-like lectin/glucanases superfamily